MSFFKARELLRIAEMAKARYRGVCLRDIMSELSVNERTARRIAYSGTCAHPFRQHSPTCSGVFAHQ